MHPIPLDNIIPLEDLSGEVRSQYAARPIVEQHVKNLMHIPSEDLPPVTVMLTERGHVLIDGAHRVERARRKEEKQINAEFVDFVSLPDLIKKAYLSNQTHGLPDKVSRRVDFALWLIVNDGLSVRDAADIAKCDPSAITRRKQKLRGQETEERPVENERAKPLIRFFKALEGLKDYKGTDEEWFSDLRQVLGSVNEAIEDIQENLVALVESYSQVVNTR